MGSTLSSVRRDGEGIVQTTNSLSGAAKAEVVWKSADPNRSWGFKSPRPHHHFPQWARMEPSWSVFWGRNRPALARHRATHSKRLHTNVCSVDCVIALSCLWPFRHHRWNCGGNPTRTV